MSRAFIGFGSNIAPSGNVRKALFLLAGRTRIVAISTVYRTAPLGRPEQSAYFNGVVEIETELSPGELKRDVLREIERELGRTRTADRYAVRTIDLDLLIYDDLVWETGDVILPDPDIDRRPFLAIPLCELAPHLVLPGTGKPICGIAPAFAPTDMHPLFRYTQWLRKDIFHGRERNKPGENQGTGI